MTKTENEKKYDFITRAYETILQCIPAETRACRQKVQVRITHQNYSRYIRFHAYGRDLAFQIYGDGNIAVELKEALHSDHNDNPGAKSQGMKQLMAGGGIALVGATLIPLLSGLFG